MLNTYWQVGRTIVEREQNGNLKAQYGKKLLLELSKRLMTELGVAICVPISTISTNCTCSTQKSR
jgi:hypothetical protein